MKIGNIICISSALACFAGSAPAAVVDYLPISLEQASSLTGPWTPARVGTANLTTDGKLLVPAEFNQGFWRLQIGSGNKTGFALGLPLINVPPTTLKIAQDFLAVHSSERGEEGQSESEWGSVRLADVATPMYDPAVDGGRTPAYLEFKVIANETAPTVGRTTPAPVRPERGFIQVSLTEDDFPIIAWSTDGITPVEKLRARAGTAEIKPVAFGPGLLVGETPDGRIAATLGSLLSKPHPDLMQFAGVVGSSFYDSETGESNRTPAIPLTAPFDSYASYQAMKDDYQTNEFYVSVRTRKRDVAKIDWLFARGATFPHLNVTVGDPTIQFAGREVRNATLHVPDDAAIARVTPLGRDGLQIEGLTPGGGMLHVQFASEDEYFTLTVGDPTGPAPQSISQDIWIPGWRITKQFYAGTKDDQCWYHQFQSLDFGGDGVGNDVGCGPVAWTMLMGWWDYKGVPAIFRPYFYGSGIDNFKLGEADAPKSDMDSHVKAMMRAFRFQWVDPLYCNVVTGDCGTPPDKMAEGIQYFDSLAFLYNAVYLPFAQKNIMGQGHKMTWTWVSYNGINDHNKLARESIANGWPSIMGVGFLKHYILAYGYKEVQFELLPGKYVWWTPWLRCNWGDGGGAVWHQFQDNWFFATKCHFWQKLTNFQSP